MRCSSALQQAPTSQSFPTSYLGGHPLPSILQNFPPTCLINSCFFHLFSFVLFLVIVGKTRTGLAGSTRNPANRQYGRSGEQQNTVEAKPETLQLDRKPPRPVTRGQPVCTPENIQPKKINHEMNSNERRKGKR